MLAQFLDCAYNKKNMHLFTEERARIHNQMLVVILLHSWRIYLLKDISFLCLSIKRMRCGVQSGSWEDDIGTGF